MRLRATRPIALLLVTAAGLGGCAQTSQTAGNILAVEVGASGRLPRAGVPAQPPEAPRIRGALLYRERIALPPGATAEIELVEQRKNGAVVATTRVPVTGQVPIEFTLAPPEASVRADRLYALRARLLVDGKVWFQTERPKAVSVSAAAGPVEILLVSARK